MKLLIRKQQNGNRNNKNANFNRKINFNYENEYKKKTILGLKTQNDKYPVHFIGNQSN